MQYWKRLGIPRASVMRLPYASHLEYYMQGRADSLEQRQAVRGSLGLSAERLLGLFVGRLVAPKVLDILLDALRLLPSSGRPNLLVVGDGPERANLEAHPPRRNCLSRFLASARPASFPRSLPQPTSS